MKKYFRLIRVHQWVKNLLIFLPLILAHKISDQKLLLESALGFLAFCLIASAGYLLNDLLDLEHDRKHPTKRMRPLASGQISSTVAMIIFAVFIVLGFLVAQRLSLNFSLILGLYFFLSLSYSMKLKRIVLVDIFILALLYTLRIISGGIAAELVVSAWLKAFSMFFFLSLALVKRFSELLTIEDKENGKASGRGYLASDLEMLASMGTASGYLAALVLALYINNEDVIKLYSNPGALWLICPLILYWTSRVWLLAHRGKMHEDPIVFAITDKTSYFIGALSSLIVYLAV